jgi:hypothetical protein
VGAWPACPGRDDVGLPLPLDPQPGMNYLYTQFVFEKVVTALPATSQLAGKASFFYWHNSGFAH